jgi:SAM-dependent methyltransferase
MRSASSPSNRRCWTGTGGRASYGRRSIASLLGDLPGKTILEFGCGEGEDSMILAKFGARVTGLDVSPRAIELAKRRAALNGVSDRTEFVCAPLNASTLPEKSFDIIWIDNVLHHVLDDLDDTMRALLKAAKPAATIICTEPVNLNKTLRKIRFLVPVHTEVTPGERPLEKDDIAVIQALIPGLRPGFLNAGSAKGRTAVKTWRQRLARLFELEGQGDRMHSMEGLRGLAVTLVFFVHSIGGASHGERPPLAARFIDDDRRNMKSAHRRAAAW